MLVYLCHLPSLQKRSRDRSREPRRDRLTPEGRCFKVRAAPGATREASTFGLVYSGRPDGHSCLDVESGSQMTQANVQFTPGEMRS